MQKLEEEATFNLNKKKNIVAERKEARIEIDEAEKYKRLHNNWVNIGFIRKLILAYFDNNAYLSSALAVEENRTTIVPSLLQWGRQQTYSRGDATTRRNNRAREQPSCIHWGGNSWKTTWTGKTSSWPDVPRARYKEMCMALLI